MNRLRTSVVVAGALLAFGFSALALASPADVKEKPKNAATLDDNTAMLTENTGGQEKTSKVELKYSLKVKGWFDGDGFNIEEVEDDGPAAKLADPSGGQQAKLEKGDIITQVGGKQIKSADDYVKAMNSADDPTKIKIKVKDVKTGQEREFTAEAMKR
jgi:S1-C subfamily serine protease